MTRARSLSRLANSNAFTVDGSNNVGIGSTQPDVRLDVDGDMNVTGTLTYEDVTNVETAGITTTGGLVVTGLGATIGGITTFFGDLNFGAAGVGGTITPLGHGGFTGIVTALGFQATGVVTAASFRGDGSQLSGVDSSNLVDSGDTNRVAANTAGVVITGIATATEFLHVLGTAGASGKGIEARSNSTQATDTNKAIRVRNNSDTDTFNVSYRGAATFGGDLTIPDKIIHSGDTNTAIRFPGNDTFTVETSGSEALRVDGSQRLLIGGTSSLNQYGSESVLQLQGTGFNASTIALRRDQNNANPPGVVFAKSRSGSLGGNTIVQDGDSIGTLVYAAADGTDLTSIAAQIKVEIDGTPGSNDTPGRIVFETTANGAASSTERLRIDNSGRLLLGTSTAKAIASSTTATAIFRDDGGSHTIIAVESSAASGGGALALSANRNNSDDGFTILQDGDTMGEVRFAGSDGTDLQSTGARIRAFVDGTPGSNDMPGRLTFETTADGASSPTERVRIDSSGRVRIGSQSGSDRTSHRLQVSSDGSDSLLSLQNFSNSDGSEMDIAFYALNTNNASVKFAQIVARADETQANSSQQGSLKFSVNIGASLTDVAKFNTNGHFVPASNDTYDLGGTSERWRNIYTGDLNLSNEGSANDVDGTWGDYTIQEGENDLFLLNRRNGKKFKFMLQEVS